VIARMETRLERAARRIKLRVGGPCWVVSDLQHGFWRFLYVVCRVNVPEEETSCE